MSKTYVIEVSCLLPERHHRAAGIAHDRIDTGWAAGLVFEQLGTELDRALRRCRNVVDLHVRDPAADLPLLRRDRRERPGLACQHCHPGGAVRGPPAEKLLVERYGIPGFLA